MNHLLSGPESWHFLILWKQKKNERTIMDLLWPTRASALATLFASTLSKSIFVRQAWKHCVHNTLTLHWWGGNGISMAAQNRTLDLPSKRQSASCKKGSRQSGRYINCFGTAATEYSALIQAGRRDPSPLHIHGPIPVKKQRGLQLAVEVSIAKKEPVVKKEKRSELTMEADERDLKAC